MKTNDLRKSGKMKPWDIVALGVGVLCLLAFVTFVILILISGGSFADILMASYYNGLMLLCGIVCLLLTRKKEVEKRWKRLLIAGTVSNALVTVTVVMMLGTILLGQAG